MYFCVCVYVCLELALLFVSVFVRVVCMWVRVAESQLFEEWGGPANLTSLPQDAFFFQALLLTESQIWVLIKQAPQLLF